MQASYDKNDLTVLGRSIIKIAFPDDLLDNIELAVNDYFWFKIINEWSMESSECLYIISMFKTNKPINMDNDFNWQICKIQIGNKDLIELVPEYVTINRNTMDIIETPLFYDGR